MSKLCKNFLRSLVLVLAFFTPSWAATDGPWMGSGDSKGLPDSLTAIRSALTDSMGVTRALIGDTVSVADSTAALRVSIHDSVTALRSSLTSAVADSMDSVAARSATTSSLLDSVTALHVAITSASTGAAADLADSTDSLKARLATKIALRDSATALHAAITAASTGAAAALVDSTDSLKVRLATKVALADSAGAIWDSLASWGVGGASDSLTTGKLKSPSIEFDTHWSMGVLGSSLLIDEDGAVVVYLFPDSVLLLQTRIVGLLRADSVAATTQLRIGPEWVFSSYGGGLRLEGSSGIVAFFTNDSLTTAGRIRAGKGIVGDSLVALTRMHSPFVLADSIISLGRIKAGRRPTDSMDVAVKAWVLDTLSAFGGGTVLSVGADSGLTTLAANPITGSGTIIPTGALRDLFQAGQTGSGVYLRYSTIGDTIQAYDAELQAIAGVTSADNKYVYFTGSGTATTGFLFSFGRSLLSLSNSADWRDTLDVEIGKNVQAWDTALDSLAASGATGTGTFLRQGAELTSALTVGIYALQGYDHGGSVRSSLRLGSSNAASRPYAGNFRSAYNDTAYLHLASNNDSRSVMLWVWPDSSFGLAGAIGGPSWNKNAAMTAGTVPVGRITGVLPAANGGTGASTYAALRDSLDVVAGTNVEAWDADLDSLAKWTLSAKVKGLLKAANVATIQDSIDLVPGTDVQAQDATLSAFAGLASEANKLPYFSGTDAMSMVYFWDFGRSLIASANAATARGVLEAQAVHANLTALVDSGGTGTGKFVRSRNPVFDDDITIGTHVLKGASNVTAKPTQALGYSGLSTYTGIFVSANTDTAALSVSSTGASTVILWVAGTSWGLTGPGGNVSWNSTGTMITGVVPIDRLSGSIAIANGGTGAANYTDAATNLHLSVGTYTQAYDVDLQTIAGLSKNDKNFIVANGSTWLSRTASEARTDMGVAIGTDVQGYSTRLAAIVLASDSDSQFLVGSATGWTSENPATARTSLQLGTIATQNANNVAITGGSVTGITDLAVADGGTGASSASAARTALGVGTAGTQDSTYVFGKTSRFYTIAVGPDTSGKDMAGTGGYGIGANPIAPTYQSWGFNSNSIGLTDIIHEFSVHAGTSKTMVGGLTWLSDGTTENGANLYITVVNAATAKTHTLHGTGKITLNGTTAPGTNMGLRLYSIHDSAVSDIDGGDTQWTVVSDSTKKYDRRKLTKAQIDKIEAGYKKLGIYTYKWKDSKTAGFGPMAQEVYALDKQFVPWRADPTMYNGEATSYYTILMVQRLMDRVTALESRLAKLEGATKTGGLPNLQNVPAVLNMETLGVPYLQNVN